MQEKIKTYIQFAIRSGKYVIGDSVLYKIRLSGNVKVVLLANDASELTKKKYEDKLKFYNTRYYFCSSKEELGSFLNKEEVAVLGILDSGLANQIIKLLKEGE